MIHLAPDILLMHYAAGTLHPAEALVIAAHVALNPKARQRVTSYESMGGKMMDDMAPAAVTDECLSAIMARIDACAEEHKLCVQKCPEAVAKLSLPTCVEDMIFGHCTELRALWVRAKSGADMIRLNISCKTPAPHQLHLLRMPPKKSAPRHRHTGREITLVLSGSYSDEFGIYGPGDISVISDKEINHQPVAGDHGCLCLTLTEGEAHAVNPFLRMVQIIWR